jgi:HAE1 family hydrophobic/amphiphilic exporter-1
VTMMVVSIGLSVKLMPPAEYLPEGNRNLIIGVLMPPPGYNLDQMLQIGRQVETHLQPYWEDVPNHADPQQLGRPHIASFFFVAHGRSIFMGARTSDATRVAELIPIFQAALSDTPGIIPIISQASLFERGVSGGRTIDIEITGPDLQTLIELGGQVFDQVSEMYPAAATGTFVRPIPSLDLGSPELHIERNAEKASQRGVVTTELGYTVNALVDGAYAGDYWHRGKKIDLVITAPDDFSARTQDVAQLPIGTPSGEMVPLSAVADLKLSSGPEQINRIDRQRAITIQVKPGPEIALEEAMQRIDREVLDNLRQGGLLANGLYHLHLSGTADQLKQMRQALSSRLLLAIVITYLLIAALYESFLYPLVIMVSVPMAAVGGFAGLRLLGLFTHQSFDTLTMLGFVILVGTVVNNAILIVNQALVLIREQGMPHREAVVESVRGRIRPIFMSTSTTVLGMLPLVLLPGAGSELYRGLGSVVLGGLIVSTVVTLFLVPMLFTLTTEATDGLRRWLGRRRHAHAAVASPHALAAGLPTSPRHRPEVSRSPQVS